MLTVTVDVCANAPSKKRVICRMYELLEDPDPDRGDNCIPKEWLVQVIDRLSKPCAH